ncbi:MAG: flagellar protein FliT [Thiopseudomonas sp.]|nr:flagellar protein FliT [Thiopseudomonas sp.]MCK9466157.1 flagellar protein FliT [Thiopseudomonas sp.]
MSAVVLQLQQSGTALREALMNKDWEAIGALDLQCRQAVDDALSDPHSPAEELREKMQELLELYRDLVSTCQTEQKRIADELVGIQQSKKNAKIYQLFE